MFADLGRDEKKRNYHTWDYFKLHHCAAARNKKLTGTVCSSGFNYYWDCLRSSWDGWRKYKKSHVSVKNRSTMYMKKIHCKFVVIYALYEYVNKV